MKGKVVVTSGAVLLFDPPGPAKARMHRGKQLLVSRAGIFHDRDGPGKRSRPALGKLTEKVLQIHVEKGNLLLLERLADRPRSGGTPRVVVPR